jgi:hypothetical protein
VRERDPVAVDAQQPALLRGDEAGGRRGLLDDSTVGCESAAATAALARAGRSSAIAAATSSRRLSGTGSRRAGSSAGAGPSARAISSANSGLPPDASAIFSSAGRGNA